MIEILIISFCVLLIILPYALALSSYFLIKFLIKNEGVEVITMPIIAINAFVMFMYGKFYYVSINLLLNGGK